VVSNTFAYRCTDQGLLVEVSDPIGPANDKHIIEMAKQAAVQLEKKSVSENDGELHPYVGAVIVK
jgi:hypothetical protein